MPDSLQSQDLGPTPIQFSSRFKVHSQTANADFIIDVATPAPYLQGDAPWPILFVTDGNLAFPTTAATATILPIEPGGPRPVCVVGIGYALADQGEAGEHLALRNRDLTPVRDEDWERRMRDAPPPFWFGDALATGGGEQFLDFILLELTPWLAGKFPVNPGDRTLVGNSFGGTLALHAMFTRPGAFTRYLAISPSLWWAKGHILDLEESYAKANDDLDAHLCLYVGEAEQAQAPEMKMVSELIAFSERLESRAYRSLTLSHEILPGETHVSAFNAALSNGLRRLFGATFLV